MPDFKDVAKNLPNGGDNMGGTEILFYYALTKWILTEAVLPDTYADVEEAALLTGAYTFKPGFCFKTVYTTQETGEASFEQIGPVDGKSFLNKAAIQHPGNTPEFLGFCRASANEDFVILAPTANGKVHAIGSIKFPAKPTEGSGTVGKAYADANQGMIVFQAAAKAPIPIYDGAISLTPAP